MRHYPNGIYSKKHFIFFFLSIFIMLVVSITVGVVAALYTDFDIFSDLLLTIGIVLLGSVVFSFMNVKFNEPRNLMQEFVLTSDYNKFMEGLDKLLEEKLHPETRGFILCIKANYLFSKDKEAAKTLFESIKVPKNKFFLKQYRFVELMYLINTNNEREFKNKVSMFEIAYPKSREIEPIIVVSKIFFSTEDIPYVEQMFSIHTPYEFQNVDNCNTLCIYFDKRNNPSKALEYAHKLKEIAPTDSEYSRYAESLIMKYPEE